MTTVNPVNQEKTKLQTVKDVVQHPYFVFLQKKMVFYGIVTFVALTLIFFIPRLMPGNPADRILPPIQSGEDPEAYANRQEAFMEYYGLNDPIWEQYLLFWGNLFRGDLGPSFTYPGQSTVDVLIPAVIFTFSVVIPVIIISFFIGNWIGSRSAFDTKSNVNKFAYYTSLLAQSIPFYWLAIVFYWYFVYEHRIFSYGYSVPGTEAAFTWEFISGLLKHYALPFMTLLIGFTGGWATGMRSMTLYELESSYLLYAKQLGFKDQTIRRYAQRNAILPQVTGLNLRLGDAIGATLVLEWVFGWPGVGDILLNSAVSQDFPLMMGSSIIVIVIVVIGNMIIDVLYGFIDPRIQSGDRS